MAMAQQRTTIVGVFQDRAKADDAIKQLLDAGFREDQIGVVMRHGEAEERAVQAGEEHSLSASGVAAGALTGLGIGAVAGVGVLAGAIPVIGPAIAAGTLGVILSNAAAGAGIIGLIGALVGAGVPEHEASYYNDEFEAGRTIVTVNADARDAEAAGILRGHGAYDMSNRTVIEPPASTTAWSPAASDRTNTDT